MSRRNRALMRDPDPKLPPPDPDPEPSDPPIPGPNPDEPGPDVVPIGRVSAHRPAHSGKRLAGCHHVLGRLILLRPLHQRGKRIEILQRRAAAAVIHAWHFE